jgi:hypothetical protein
MALSSNARRQLLLPVEADRIVAARTQTESLALDGSVTVLADGRHALSGSDDRTLRLWDLETGAELARLTFNAATSAIAWWAERRRTVVGDGRGRVHLIDIIECSLGPSTQASFSAVQ